MTFLEWFLFFIVLQVVHFLGTYKLYIKAGKQPWEAIIPIYNAIVLMSIIKRPKWWVFLLFLPVINLLMFPIIWIETSRSFGFLSRKDTFLVVLTLGLYLFYINNSEDAKHRPERSLKPQSNLGEWVSSIAFAIVAATLVHTYVMQPYTIPTSSLEKTLLVGDYLFVSKFHYGARVPMTTIAAPMLHDSLPTSFIGKKNVKSYLKKPLLPYLRIPGFQKIKRNDIVVFNWPVDTLVHWTDPSRGIEEKPIDKRTNYVKRCVGIAGDTLSIVDGYVHINGKKNQLPGRSKVQFFYTYEAKNDFKRGSIPAFLNQNLERSLVYKIPNKYWEDTRLQQALANNAALTKIGGDSVYTEVAGGAAPNILRQLEMVRVNNKININMTEEEAERLRKDPNTVSVTKIVHHADANIFPKLENGWSQDNMGPIYIPEEGKTIQLTTDNVDFYKEIITRYEFNNLDVVGETIFINGKKVTEYTFKQDYYWMMGDNRHNSLDSRYWGFVPFDHVVGKPVFIWFSIKDGKIRKERLFTTVGGDDEPKSYLNYFFIALGLYLGYSFYKSRKKKK